MHYADCKREGEISRKPIWHSADDQVFPFRPSINKFKQIFFLFSSIEVCGPLLSSLIDYKVSPTSKSRPVAGGWFKALVCICISARIRVKLSMYVNRKEFSSWPLHCVKAYSTHTGIYFCLNMPTYKYTWKFRNRCNSFPNKLKIR